MIPIRLLPIACAVFCILLVSNISAQSTSNSQKIKDFKTLHKTRFEQKIKSRKTEYREKLGISRKDAREKKSKWFQNSRKKNISGTSSGSLKKVAGIEAIPSAERAALIALYNSTNGDNWTSNSGWKTPPLDADGFAMPGTENTWVGLVINSDHIERIILTSNNLSGTIPAELADLANLIVLNFSENNLTGSIPTELGSLANLEELVLNTNQLSGPIPTGIADPGDLPVLWGLDLGSNNFNGNIPAQLANLNALKFLYLDRNELTGSVPAELGNLSNLEELDIYHNELDGVIETEFADPGDLPNLNYLDLGGNDLTGGIPGELGNLSSLVELYLDKNNLSGDIPAGLGNLANLEKLDVSYNELDGSIAAGFADPGDLPNLKYLILEYNKLTGSIPAGIGNLTNLIYLVADNNQLNGSIPAQIGNLNNLLLLYLYENQLTGSIPAELGNMGSIFELDLWNNQLNGSIPSGMFDPGDLPNLVYLDLSTNQLTGSIPAAIANLTNLQLFAAVENQLDTMPAELGDLPNLNELYLFDNKFTSIPAGMLGAGDFPNLEVIDLCLNGISGTIPTAFENLPNLEELYLSGNKFSGEIPAELMNISRLFNNCLDLRWNALYTNNGTLRTFLAVKQDGGDWESTQTIEPLNVSPGRRLNSVSYVKWDPILYTDDLGGYDIYYSAVSGGPYTYHGSAYGKTTDTYGCSGLPEHSSYYFVVKARTNPHSENNNIITSEYSNETYIADMNYSSYPEVVTNERVTVNKGGEFTFSDLILKTYDEDADISTLLYSIQNPPQHGSLVINTALYKSEGEIIFTQNDIANGKVKYIHDDSNSTSDYFSFIVSDVEGHSTDIQTFNITIENSNNAPTVDSLQTITMLEDESYTLIVCDWYDYINDPDDADSSLTFFISCPENKLSVTCLDDTTFILTPEENYFGNTCLSVKIKDEVDSVETTVNVVIQPENDLPIISGLPSSLTMQNGDFEILRLYDLAEDVETPDSSLTWTYDASPDSLTLFYDEIEHAFVFGAKGPFVGVIEMTIIVTDEDGGTDEGTITVTITPDPADIEGAGGIPKEYSLFQNYPNPFNPTTVIRYAIPADVGTGYTLSAVNVTLKIYDILGNEVAALVNEQQSPGYYERTWNATNVSSGIYFYKLEAGSYKEIKKMILLR